MSETYPHPRNDDFKKRHPSGLLPPGPGGPYDPGMDQRITRLEDDMKEVKADLKAIRIDVSELKGRVAMLPGYGGIALVVGLIVGLSTVAQVAARLIP